MRSVCPPFSPFSLPPVSLRLLSVCLSINLSGDLGRRWLTQPQLCPPLNSDMSCLGPARVSQGWLRFPPPHPGNPFSPWATSHLSLHLQDQAVW